jgi:hypothetical protein
LRQLSSRDIIPVFDEIFSLFGIPEELKTDNGPSFQSIEFRNFAEYLGFRHPRITPLWPKANGETERFMHTIGKYIRTANIESRNWKQEMYTFLKKLPCYSPKHNYYLACRRIIQDESQNQAIIRKRREEK